MSGCMNLKAEAQQDSFLNSDIAVQTEPVR